MTGLLAHVGADAGGAALLVVTVVAAAYAVAARRAPRGRWSRWRAAAFGLGCAALLVALASPLEALAERRFSAHMAQHLLLTSIAGPALALAAVPRTLRRGLAGELGAGLHRSRWAATWRRAGRRSGGAWPAVAAAAHIGALAVWHVPVLYDLAVQATAVHLLEHLSLLGTSLALWAAVLLAHRTGAGVAFVSLFVTSVVSGGLGALITFAPEPLYASYASPAAPAGPLSPLEDQQLAGVLMWVPGGLVYLAGAAVVVAVTLRSAGRRRARLDAAGAVAGRFEAVAR